MTRGLAATPYFGSMARPLRATCGELQFAAVGAIRVLAAALAAAFASARFGGGPWPANACGTTARPCPERMNDAPHLGSRRPRPAAIGEGFRGVSPHSQHRT